MNRIKEIWPNFDADAVQEENLPLKILEAQSEAINKYKEHNEVYSAIVTSTGDDTSSIKHILYLLPVYGNGYNYRYIEFSQPIDSIYPVEIKAFQTGNNEFGTAKNETEIYKTLTNIFKDQRTQIAITQLKSMGKGVER